MLQSSALKLNLITALQTKLLPWVGSGASFALLDAPPKVIGPNRVICQEGTKLRHQRGDGHEVRRQFWRSENLNAMTVPYMGCVIEGEADIRVGTTTTMCSKYKIPGTRWIYTATEQSFFIVPPLVPLSGGGGVHWEREKPEQAFSRILWLQFHSSGIDCHFCTSSQGQHYTHPGYFVPGTEFYPLAQSLIFEMSQEASQYVALVYLHLRTILHYLLRRLENDMATGYDHSGRNIVLSSAHHFSDSNRVVEEAVRFIDLNLNTRLLTVEKVAQHLHLSPRHLARLFLRQMEIPVMTFATRRRMELAGRLFLESSFTVRQIALSCGYASIPSFIKAFTRHFGVSPSEYRASKLKDGL